MEVMTRDHTPNVLPRETSFLTGLLEPYFIAKKMFSKSEDDFKVSQMPSSHQEYSKNKPELINI